MVRTHDRIDPRLSGQSTDAKKRTVQAVVRKAGVAVFEAEFLCVVLPRHILDAAVPK